MSAEIARQFLEQRPELERVEFLYVDINGVPRGKWANTDALLKAFKGDLRLPRSSYVLDIWGDTCLLYTSDAADDTQCVEMWGVGVGL